MTDPAVGSPLPPTGLTGNAVTHLWSQSSQQDAIRRAHFVNRAALQAVRGLLETPVASLQCSGIHGWADTLRVAFAEEHHSLELVHRCLAQQRTALEDPALSGLTDSLQALERAVFTLREVGRKKLMLSVLARSLQGKSGLSSGSREDSMPIGVLSEAVRREGLSLVGRLTDQEAKLNRMIETRAALVQQVFLG